MGARAVLSVCMLLGPPVHQLPAPVKLSRHATDQTQSNTACKHTQSSTYQAASLCWAQLQWPEPTGPHQPLHQCSAAGTTASCCCFACCCHWHVAVVAEVADCCRLGWLLVAAYGSCGGCPAAVGCYWHQQPAQQAAYTDSCLQHELSAAGRVDATIQPT